MQEKYIITIKTTSRKRFGLDFMREFLEEVCCVLTNSRKCYTAKIERMEDE